MNEQDGNYWICARVEAVSCYGDWYYISCKKCGKKNGFESFFYFSLISFESFFFYLYQVVSLNCVPREIENFIIGKVYLFMISLRKEDDFLRLKPYNVKKVVSDHAVIRKCSTNILSNLDKGNPSQSLDDLFLEEYDRLSPIVNLGQDNDSLQVFFISCYLFFIVISDYFYILLSLSNVPYY